MTTTLTFTCISPIVGTTIDTYSLSDDDAARLLQCYTALMTPRAQPGQPKPQPPSADAVIHTIAQQMWGNLAQTTAKYFQQQAANAAAASVAAVNASYQSSLTPPA